VRSLYYSDTMCSIENSLKIYTHSGSQILFCRYFWRIHI